MIGATLAAAAAALIPIMNRTQASAATTSEVLVHCQDGSPLLESCTFIQKAAGMKNGNSFRVSEVQNNCDGTQPDVFSLSTTVTSSTQVQTDTRTFFEVGGRGSFPGVFGGSAEALSQQFKITGFRENTSTTVSIRASVEPRTRAAIYFRPEVVESSGFLQATYKKAEPDGTKVFFFPEKNADTVLVRFPLALDNGDPKGFYWIRSVECLSNSLVAIPDLGTADFGTLTDFGVTDTEAAPVVD